MSEPKRDPILADLTRAKQAVDSAKARFERKLFDCFQARRGTFEIARALGMSPQAVSMRRGEMSPGTLRFQKRRRRVPKPAP